MEKKTKIILSGGGTGGHIYPAVAVAEALKRKTGDSVEILFVGADGKMEMEKVPALGYDIVGLPVAGIQRKNLLKNISFPFKLMRSNRMARKVVKDFAPDAAAGFGGYASYPILRAAQKAGVPTLIQEQNSYAGVANKKLAKKASRVCVAYEGMDRFFPADKIVFTGNPLRGNFSSTAPRTEALAYFGLKEDRRTILIVGGSLGTRTLNDMMKKWADELGANPEVQVIWQTGKIYRKEMEDFMRDRPYKNIWYGPFIDRMDYAYSAADIVISRSGAGTVSELCLQGKAVIFVPSPNVAEDHQTKNAMALAEKEAALMINDWNAADDVIPVALGLLEPRNDRKRAALEENIRKLGIPDSADRVAEYVTDLIR